MQIGDGSPLAVDDLRLAASAMASLNKQRGSNSGSRSRKNSKNNALKSRASQLQHTQRSQQRSELSPPHGMSAMRLEFKARKQSYDMNPQHMTTSPNMSPTATATGSSAQMFTTLEKSKTKKKSKRDLSGLNKQRPPMANFFVPSSYVTNTRSSLPTINRNSVKKSQRSEQKIRKFITNASIINTHATTSRQITQTSGDYIDLEPQQPRTEKSHQQTFQG